MDAEKEQNQQKEETVNVNIPKYYQISENARISVLCHDGTENGRRNSLNNLVDWVDLDEEGKMTKRNISFFESKYEDLPENFKEGLGRDFKEEVEKDHWFLMRFFQRGLTDSYEPVYFADEENVKLWVK